jgi:autotransporter-associated beta strand protein
MNIARALRHVGFLALLPAVLGAQTVFVGLSATDPTLWNDATNWSGGVLPAAEDDVAIHDEFNVSLVNLTADIAFLAVDGTLTIGADGVVNIGTDAGAGYDGVVFINPNGRIQIGDGAASGSLNAALVIFTPMPAEPEPSVTPGALAFNHTDAATFTAQITGEGLVTKDGTGTLTLGGDNAYSGETHINAGTLIVAHDHAFGTSTVTLNGGALQAGTESPITLINDIVIASDFSFSSDELYPNHLILDGDITLAGSHTLTVDYELDINGVIGGNHSLTLDGDGIVVFGADNTFTGGIVLEGNVGVVVLADRAFGTGDVTVNGNNGMLALHEDPCTPALTLANNFVLKNTLSIVTSGEVHLTGTITAIVDPEDPEAPVPSLIHEGFGLLALSGSSAYQGTIYNSYGTLMINGALPNASVVVGEFGDLIGDGTVGDVVVETDGLLSPGEIIGTLTTGNVSFEEGSIFSVDITSVATGAGTGWDFLNIDGILAFNGTLENAVLIELFSTEPCGCGGEVADFDPATSYSFIIASATEGITGFDPATVLLDLFYFENTFNGTWELVQDGNNLLITYTAVPEPATTAMLLGGAFLILTVWKRRRS